jgi:outer membrane protein assembly factor BamB
MRNGNLSRVALLGCVLLIAASSLGAQDWPQWRGPNRDNKVVGFTAPATWPTELKQQWKVTVGKGESSPVLMDGKIYVFGRQGGDEVTQCLDAATGKELWKDKYAADAVTGAAAKHPGTRSTPAAGEGKVCTLGVAGVVTCLDAASGKLAWQHKTKAKLQFYDSSSPLIADGKCIVFADGLTAYDLANGETKWKWPATAPYGSPVLMTVDGVKQVVTPSAGFLAGVSLADGKTLWKFAIGTDKDYQNNFSTPIVDGQTLYYTIAAKGGPKSGGTMALRIEKVGDEFKAKELWKKPLAAHQYHTPVLKDGMLFGATTKRNFFCLDAKTGEERWIDDKTVRGECGSILDAGPVLLALTSDKNLVAFKASSKGYEEVAKYKVADGAPWSVPIVTGNRIYVKDEAGSLILWTIE